MTNVRIYLSSTISVLSSNISDSCSSIQGKCRLKRHCCGELRLFTGEEQVRWTWGEGVTVVSSYWSSLTGAPWPMGFWLGSLEAGRQKQDAWSKLKEKQKQKQKERQIIFLPIHRGWRRPWKDDQGLFLHKHLHIPLWTWWPWVSRRIPSRKGIGNFGSFPKGPLSFPPKTHVKKSQYRSTNKVTTFFPHRLYHWSFDYVNRLNTNSLLSCKSSG